MSHLRDAGVCKTRTGYLWMTDADADRCGQKNADRKMRKEKIADNSIIITFGYISFTKSCVFSFMVLFYLNPDYK